MKLIKSIFKIWIFPILVTVPLLLLSKGALATYAEQQLTLGGATNIDNIVVGAIDDGHDREIYYIIDGVDTTITNNEYDDLLPVYSNGFIAWQGFVDNKGWQIFVYNVSTQVTRQLTFGQYPSEYVQAAGNGVVWEMPKAVGSDIFYYDGLTVIRLTDDDNIDELPQTDGDYIVWQHYDGSDIEIISYEISSRTLTQLTDDDVNQTQLAIYNGEVFFKQFDGLDNEIYGLKIVGRQLRQITDNEVDDGDVRVIKGKLVWMSKVVGGAATVQILGQGTGQPQTSQSEPQSTQTDTLGYEEQQLDLEAAAAADPTASPEASSSAQPSSPESSPTIEDVTSPSPSPTNNSSPLIEESGGVATESGS